ncbi:hypothetical protein ACN28S_66660 [Cystobacter fuscus]
MSLFLAITFLQSGLDKVIDWKGNLGWLTGHFSKSLLRGVVPLLLATLTVLELAAGVLSAAGVVFLVLSGATRVAMWGAALSGLSFVALFFGQRMAKDYAGAAGRCPTSSSPWWACSPCAAEMKRPTVMATVGLRIHERGHAVQAWVSGSNCLLATTSQVTPPSRIFPSVRWG